MPPLTASPVVSPALNPSRVRHGSSIGKYAPRSCVPAVMRATGYSEKTAAQVVRPADPRNPYAKVAAIDAELRRDGLVALADTLLFPIHLSAMAAPPEESLDELLILETQAEGAENEAQQVFSIDRTPEAWGTLRARWIREIGVMERAIKAGDRQYGKPA